MDVKQQQANRLLSRIDALGVSVSQVEQILGAVGQSDHGVVLFDAKKDVYPIQFVNEGLCEITGYSSEQLLGQPYTQLLDLTHTQRSRVVSALLKRQSEELVVESKGNHGRPFFADYTFSPYYQDNTLASVTAVVRDVTAQQRQKQRLESYVNMVNGAAHNFKNTIGGVHGLAELLHENTDSLHASGELEEYVSYLYAGMKRANTQANTLFNRAKKVHSLDYSLQAKRLDEVVNRVMDSLASECASRNITCNTSLNDVYGWIDEEMYVNAVENVIGNAIKFANSQVTVLLTSRMQDTHEYAILEVRDNGPGIPAHLTETIFEPFNKAIQQQDVSEQLKESSGGFGLSYSRDQIHELGGFIDVSSTPGDGSTFEIGVRKYS